MQVAELQTELAELKFDRSKWKPTKFGDVVACVDKTCRDPAEAGLARVVGLDHLDPGELHIKRWGDISDGTSFTRTFRSGQVLFGKRRAYQRKVAIAEFDGICSGDILVFEPKGDGLLAELLPFIVQSEAFFANALGTSAGSLSPRTKWKELAKWEFMLPPKDDQRRIADLLWACEDVARSTIEAISSCRKATRAIFSDLSRSAAPRPLKSMCTIRSGTTPRRTERSYWKPEYPWLSTSQVNDRIITQANEFVSTLALKECSLPICPPNSVLVALYGEGKTRGMTALLTFEATINQAFACLVPNEDLLPMFLFLALESTYDDLRHASQGSNQKNLSGAILGQFKVPCPHKDVQSQVVSSVEKLLGVEADCVTRINQTAALRRQLSDTIWRMEA